MELIPISYYINYESTLLQLVFDPKLIRFIFFLLFLSFRVQNEFMSNGGLSGSGAYDGELLLLEASTEQGPRRMTSFGAAFRRPRQLR